MDYRSTHGTLTVIARTHGLADDAMVIDRLVRSQSRPPEQLIVIGTMDRRVQARFVPRTGTMRGAFDLRQALLAATGAVVVILDSAFDILPDHLDLLERYVDANELPLPIVLGIDGQARSPLGPVHPGAVLSAFRLGEVLGVGGPWTLLDRSDGPETWGADLLGRIARKYDRKSVEVPVHVRAIAGRSSLPIREGKCGLRTMRLGEEGAVSANRAINARLLVELRSACQFYDVASSGCSVVGGSCVVPWAAFGVDDSVVGWARSLPRGRLRRDWHVARRKDRSHKCR